MKIRNLVRSILFFVLAVASSWVNGISEKKALARYCHEMDLSFHRYGWGKSLCQKKKWLFYSRRSVQGRPLVFRLFGELPRSSKNSQKFNITLVMCGVHGDEITPIKFCYDFLSYLEDIENGKIWDSSTGERASFENRLVVLAPLVSPDSYFKKKPTRTNANGVDLNRNFPTRDFHRSALKTWRKRYKRDRRRYPGQTPMSEPETIFQVDLIQTFRPDIIISVHAPLSMLDYDGPAHQHTGGAIGTQANQLLIRMSKKARGYRIKNYPFFPGSLGNWAGHERNIPTFTLELPSSDNRYHKEYWNLFKDSLYSAVMDHL